MADDDEEEDAHDQFTNSGEETAPDSDSYRSPNMQLAEQANPVDDATRAADATRMKVGQSYPSQSESTNWANGSNGMDATAAPAATPVLTTPASAPASSPPATTIPPTPPTPGADTATAPRPRVARRMPRC